MKFKFLLLLSIIFFSGNLYAQGYRTVCDPDSTVSVNLYAGTASCYAYASFPFGYTGPTYALGGTYTRVVAESQSATVLLGSSIYVTWTESRNGSSVNRSGTATAYCTAAVPFSRVGSKVVKGQCRQEINPNDCGCVWQTNAFTGGQSGSQSYTVYRPAGSCAYDARVIYSDGRTTCSGSAWPPAIPSSSSAASSSVGNIPSGSACTWQSSPTHGAGSSSGRVEVYNVIGACTHRYKEVYYDIYGNKINTRYQ